MKRCKKVFLAIVFIEYTTKIKKYHPYQKLLAWNLIVSNYPNTKIPFKNRLRY